MKALYWRSNYVSTPQLVVVAVIAVACWLGIEYNPVEQEDPLREKKMAAAQLCESAFRAIYLERIRLSIPLDTESDPAGSGLIGPSNTPIVSNKGHLLSKRTTANPNFAAAFVGMLSEAGLKKKDVVALNVTGSFPAMNIAMYSALETLGLEAIVISSVAASEYGATHPDLTWLDMERVIFDQDLTSIRSSAASMGGVLDRAQNHSDEGKALIKEAIKRNKIPLFVPQDYEDAVKQRLSLYSRVKGKRPIKAFVNIGGGTASVGTADDKHDFKPGLNTRVPEGLERNSVMRSFVERDIPVIHVSKIRSIAREYGLADNPLTTPSVGEGQVYQKSSVRRPLIAVVLLLLFLAMYAATRFDLASAFVRKKDDKKGPEQMV